MKFDLVVKNGKLVTAEGVVDAALGVREGRVAAYLPQEKEYPSPQIIDARGKYIVPGAIDPHVHGGYGEPNRETPYSASCAAASGGITTMIDMPQSNPIIVTEDAYKNKMVIAKSESVVDSALWGGLVPGHYEDIESIFDLGGQAFKVFMCRTDNFPMCDDGFLLKGMKKIGYLGGMVGVHAENDTLIQQQIDDSGELQTVESYLGMYPSYTELEAIERLIFLAKLAPKCKVNVAHMSIPEGARLIKRAKFEGVDITAETTPHYLSLTADDLRKLGGIAKCDPPVRSKKDVEDLWSYVFDGTIDFIASDHSPQIFEKKIVPNDCFNKASQGIPGLQTMVPVMITEGIHQRGLDWANFVRFTSLNAAKRFGLYPQKGALRIGSDADFYLLDLEREWRLDANDLHYVNKHSVYTGKVFKGFIEKTFVRGHLICDKNRILADKGFGIFIPMKINGI